MSGSLGPLRPPRPRGAWLSLAPAGCGAGGNLEDGDKPLGSAVEAHPLGARSFLQAVRPSSSTLAGMNLAPPTATRSHPTPYLRRLRTLPWAASLALTLGGVLAACGPTGAGGAGGTDGGNSCNVVDPSDEQPVVPMMPAQAPMIVPAMCQPFTCGGEAWYVQFTLPQAAANSGWIVQQVTSTVNGNVQQWWEAFYIAQFNKTTVGIYNSLYDDLFAFKPSSNTSGTQSVQGIAEFYAGTLPSNFVRGGVPSAGCLRATTTKPDFWTGDGTPHSLMVSWDCTDGNANPNTSVQTVPPGSCP